ncbi:MAG: hypothetical protein WBA51_18330, partial [Erythrobacter sp.]
RLSEADFRDASFLDQRLLQAQPGQQQRAMQWGDWSVIAPQTAGARDDARFIFHIGHVGSTLIARLLGEAADTLALREPQLLRQFAEFAMLEGEAHSPWPPGRMAERLPLVRQWLSRTFRADQRALIKATSFVSDIAPELMGTTRKAVFLKLSAQRYLQTILAGDASRQELAVFSPTRIQRLNARIGEPVLKLWELDETKRAALGWACEMAALEAASNHNVLWVDFDAFLAQPAAQLSQIAQHLGIALSDDQAQQLASGPMMQRYSKAPEHGYSPQLREDVLAKAASERGSDIRAALDWLEQAAKSHQVIAATLARD